MAISGSPGETPSRLKPTAPGFLGPNPRLSLDPSELDPGTQRRLSLSVPDESTGIGWVQDGLQQLGFEVAAKLLPTDWTPDYAGTSASEGGAVRVWVFERNLNVDLARSEPFLTIARALYVGALGVLVATFVVGLAFAWGPGLVPPLVILCLILLMAGMLSGGYGAVYWSEVVAAGWISPGESTPPSSPPRTTLDLFFAGASVTTVNVGGKSTAHREVKESFATSLTAQALQTLLERLQQPLSG